MYKVVIADDETIMRVTLRSMIDWESYGFRVEQDFVGGMQTLAYLKENSVDLLITDMKMPDMSGIELMEELKRLDKLPVTVVLSGYNEFELVRRAFRLGAYDYLLKSDLNEETIGKLLNALKEKVFYKEQTGEQPDESETRDFYRESRETRKKPEPGKYAAVILEVDDFLKQASRFGDGLADKMQTPMLELARQIPRVVSRTILYAEYPSRYVLYYKVREEMSYQENVKSIVRQIQSVWRSYMNISVSAAISAVTDEKGVEEAENDCSELLRLAVLYGRGAVCTAWEQGELLQYLKASEERLKKVAYAVCMGEQVKAEEEKRVLFLYLNTLSLEEAKKEALSFIVLLADRLKEYEEDIFLAFPEEVNYVKKMERPQSVREIELWLSNYIRWIENYMGSRHDERQIDVILKAKRFMADNYANPELTLHTVADYVGLNEKYFSSRFTKETGCTFSKYLTDIRMQRAGELIRKTDKKMYEISSYVGYNSVEHFNRTFKKAFGVSPADYRKQFYFIGKTMK